VAGLIVGEPDIPEEPLSRLAADVAGRVAGPLLAAADGDADTALRTWTAVQSLVAAELAELLDGGAGPARALVTAADADAAAGGSRAESLAARAVALAPDPVTRADAHRCLARLGNWRGNAARAAALAESAAGLVEPHDARRAAELLLDATLAWLHVGRLDVAERTARRALDAAVAWPELAAAARLDLAWVLVARGDRGGLDLFEAIDLGAVGAADVGAGVFVGGLLVWLGRHDQARTLLGRSEATARRTDPAALPFALGAVADLEYRTGAWLSGYAAATEGEAHAARLGSRNLRGLLLLRLARFDAATGSRANCLARLGAVEEISQAAGVVSLARFAASTRGLLHLGAGELDPAIAAFLTARTVGRETGLGHPGIDPDGGDLIEALARSGRSDEAAEVVAELEREADRWAYPPALAAAARGRLLLAADDDVERHAGTALAAHDALTMPFERARTLLVLGERRRRAGNRHGARLALDQARGVFSRLGAVPWAERAATELRAAGARVPGDASPALHRLSPQELQVARVVADGATNREAAGTLYLSEKSIERHLTSVYRKLALRSRADLARLLATSDDEGFPSGGDPAGRP
jgi:DNA-binding CsgD family transcriptional regulator/tetratricopeptide (TPR) repeat protein